MNVEKFNAEFRKHINENCMRYNGPVNLEVDEWDAQKEDHPSAGERAHGAQRTVEVSPDQRADS